MANRRLINKKICQDERVDKLPLPAQLFYTWMLLHTDCEGRLKGNAKILNRLVFPLKNYAHKRVDDWLNLMGGLKKNGRGLLERYEVDGIQYIFLPGFFGEQSPVASRKGEPSWKDREAVSEIPPPPEELLKKLALRVAPPAPKPEPTEPTSHTADIVDEKLKAIVVSYEDNIGQATPILYERLKDISATYTDGWFQKAVVEALNYNKRNLKYIETILERWRVEGFQKPTKKSNGRDFEVD